MIKNPEVDGKVMSARAAAYRLQEIRNRLARDGGTSRLPELRGPGSPCNDEPTVVCMLCLGGVASLQLLFDLRVLEEFRIFPGEELIRRDLYEIDQMRL